MQRSRWLFQEVCAMELYFLFKSHCRDFDDILLQRIQEVSFEDDIRDVPSPPDVSNYLVSEDDGSSANGNKESLCFDGMVDAEAERRLKEAVLASTTAPSLPPASFVSVKLDPRVPSSLPLHVAAPPMLVPQSASQTPFPTDLFSQAGPLVRPLGNISPQEMCLHTSSGQEEGEISESEVDQDTRRRLLILQHGQDFRDSLPNKLPFPVSGPAPVPGPLPVPGPGPGSVPVPWMQSRGNWCPVDDHMNPGPLSRLAAKEYPIGPVPVHIEKPRPPLPPFQRRTESSLRPDRPFPERQRPPREARQRDDRFRSTYPVPSLQSF